MVEQGRARGRAETWRLWSAAGRKPAPAWASQAEARAPKTYNKRGAGVTRPNFAPIQLSSLGRRMLLMPEIRPLPCRCPCTGATMPSANATHPLPVTALVRPLIGQ
jgi:hypothetical protein